MGQNRFDEIDLIENGNNYGWHITEGDACFEPIQRCDRTGRTDPVLYITGIRGNLSQVDLSIAGLDGLTGQYIYGDFISGWIWALGISDTENPENSLLVKSGLAISAFGVDADNELYITAFDGKVYRLVRENP